MNTRADLEAFVRDKERVRLFSDGIRYLTRDAFAGESEWNLFAKMRALLADREAKLAALTDQLENAAEWAVRAYPALVALRNELDDWARTAAANQDAIAGTFVGLSYRLEEVLALAKEETKG